MYYNNENKGGKKMEKGKGPIIITTKDKERVFQHLPVEGMAK